MSGKGQGTDPRHPIFNCIFPSINMYIFVASYCSYDDDPCETLVKRGTDNAGSREGFPPLDCALYAVFITGLHIWGI